MPRKKNSSVKAAVITIKKKNTGNFTDIFKAIVKMSGVSSLKLKTKIMHPMYNIQTSSILSTVLLSKRFSPVSLSVFITFSFLNPAISSNGKSTRNSQFEVSLIILILNAQLIMDSKKYIKIHDKHTAVFFLDSSFIPSVFWFLKIIKINIINIIFENALQFDFYQEVLKFHTNLESSNL